MRRYVVVFVIAVAMCLGATEMTTSAASATVQLVYSKGNTTGTAASFRGSPELSGTTTVFLSGSTTAITAVSYNVTDASGKVLAKGTSQRAPFPFTFNAAAQTRSVTAVATTSTKRTVQLTGSFNTRASRAKATANAGATARVTGPAIYVATNGNDSNSGTSATSPKKTIEAGMKAAKPGYTVLVGPGKYEGNIETTKSGSKGKFITIRSSKKHAASINGEDDSTVTIKHPYVRFQDFTVTGKTAHNGILVEADNVEVLGNNIHTICQFLTGGSGWEGGAGVYTGPSKASNVLINGNVIHDIGKPGSTEQLVHGMYLPTHVTNGRVTNNVIYKVEDFGLHPYDETEASGWHFINNTIANTGRGILQAPNGVTRNNIVFNTRGEWYDIRGDGNVVENNMGGGTGEGGGDGVTEGNPMFVDPAKDDYRIKPESPAVNRGTATGAPKTDYTGKTRSGGIDLGAFEASPTGSAL